MSFRARCLGVPALLPVLLLALLLTVVSCATARSGTARSASSWLEYADVQQAGFDPEALRAVCERADRLRSGALMAVFRGHVILACGDVERPFETRSMRKSLVSGLYGTAVSRGEIDLNATLASLAIDDDSPLTPTEKSATIRHVISARSGIYLPAAYAPTSQDRRPARGSHSPGSHWFYNNWDFNVAGVVYERATGEDLYASFAHRIATPLGMEDWKPADGFRVYEPTKSRHPAHTFRISTRDLARFGQLYLQQGRWEGRQLLPAGWIAESTRPHTDDGDGTGYGYMWWTYQAGSAFTTARYPMLGKYTFYRAFGTGEHGLWVIPAADLVVVHRADTDHFRSVSGEDHWKLAESILAARRGEPVARPELRPLRPMALSSQLPPPMIPEYRALSAAAVNDYLGDYAVPAGPAELVGRKLTPGGTIRVFLFDRKPYVHLPGVGDALMFPNGKDTFTTRVGPGLEITFDRGANDDVSGVTFTLDGRTFSARAIGKRTVAITFDDLPATPAGLVANDVASLETLTRQLLSAVRTHGVPAVGFVNEGGLFVEGEGAGDADRRIGLLRMWLDAGLELGNHTYSHRDLNTMPLDRFQADVLRGETVTRKLSKERGQKLRYFRHPFLHVGADLKVRREFEAFLSSHGYTVAPVTVDNDEFVYAAAYAKALRRGDSNAAARIADDYLRYMEEVFTFFEDVSRRVTGREIPQILLLHANALNAARFDALAQALKRRGYRFVSVAQALEDPAYRLRDDFVGAPSNSWFNHWEITAGRPPVPTPGPPEWISTSSR